MIRMSLPAAAEPLVRSIDGVFTRPTLVRFVVLMTGLIVTAGRRTVSRALRTVSPLLEGHWSNYHRLYSAARFSMWSLSLALVRQVIALVPGDAPIVMAADDTVDEKPGHRVWARWAWRDPRRASRAHDATAFGHKWLMMGVVVSLPFAERPWVLPILSGMCVSEKLAKKLGVRPKSAARLTRQLLIRMMRWFPDRRFILLGDGQVVTHETASFASRHADRVIVVGRLREDASLWEAPKHPGRRQRGGTRSRKGRRRPAPWRRVEALRESPAVFEEEVAWYGSSRRVVRHVGETALWFNKHSRRRHNGAVVPIRWVCVLGDERRDLHDAYFFTSDPTMPPRRIIELYALRWNIEVTIEESRALLGLGTTRHWCRQSVLRATPTLLGLFTAVSLIWNELCAESGAGKASARHAAQLLPSQTPCYRKHALTFADALFAVRRQIWEQTLLGHPRRHRCLTFLSRPLRELLLWHLASAA